jgi:glutamyl-tRNA reductase
MQWMSTRQAVPAIRSLHARGDAIRHAELDRARRALARGESPEQVVEQLAHALTAKFMHGHTSLLHGPNAQREHLLPIIDQLLPDRAATAPGASGSDDDSRSASS